MKFTLKTLRRARACEGQLKIFREEFGESAETTYENALRAVQLNLDVGWVVCRFLSARAFGCYDIAQSLAREQYERAKNTAMAMATSPGVTEVELNQCCRDIAEAQEQFKKDIATAFVAACSMDEKPVAILGRTVPHGTR